MLTKLNIDIVAAACHNQHYGTIWRVSLGIGVVFPLVLFILRLRLKEPEEFAKESMKRKTPYLLVLRYYWFRLAAVSLIWFVYDVSLPVPVPRRGCPADRDAVLDLRLRHLCAHDPRQHL